MKQLITVLLVAAISLSACEDNVNLNIKKGTSYPVLDAWITTLPGPQVIRLTQSVPYTQEAPSPIISDAVITLTDLTSGDVYPFTFKDTGYVYEPKGGVQVGVTGHTYKLHIEYKDEVFEATDTIKRVPPIDSISIKYKTKAENGVPKDGYEARFYAKDIAGGSPDYYWIRSFRNNTNTRVEDDNSMDGAFDQTLDDGADFVYPIEIGITDPEKPYQKGETVIVQIRSLSYQSHNFISQTLVQLNNGGLFATVLENVKTNAVNVTSGGGKLKILGWFGTSAVSSAEKIIQ